MCNPRNQSHHRTLAAPLSPRRGEGLREEGGVAEIRDKYCLELLIETDIIFLQSLQIWRRTISPWGCDICDFLLSNYRHRVARCLEDDECPCVSAYHYGTGWCSDRCLLSPQCDHWQWGDHTSGSINYFTALATSLGVNNKHNHQDNPPTRASSPPAKVLLS